MLHFNDLSFPTSALFISKCSFLEVFKAPSGFHGKHVFLLLFKSFLVRRTFTNCFAHLKMATV